MTSLIGRLGFHEGMKSASEFRDRNTRETEQPEKSGIQLADDALAYL